MIKKFFLIGPIIIVLFLTGGCTLFPSVEKFSSGSGRGIWKSNDKGENWQEKNSIKDSQQKISGLNINEIFFDNSDSRLIYAVSSGGLHYSEDAADSWHLIYGRNGINDVVLNPKAKGLIYIAAGNQVFKTTDGGKNWHLIYTEAMTNTNIIGVAISNFDTSKIYILTNNGALMVSNDWGESWKLQYDFKTKLKKLFVDPDDSQILLAAAENGLYRSVNEGISWTEIVKDQNKNFPGIEQFRDLYFTRNQGKIIYLCRYGIMITKDKGTTWQAVKTVSSPGAVEIRVVAYNPKDIDELYYVVDNVLYHTLDAGRNWKVRTLPHNSKFKVKQLVVDFYDPNNLYLGLGQ